MDNKIGITPEQAPRTYAMDFQPFQCINLIDGNPGTYWISRGQAQPDVQEEWVRIDMAMERPIREIVLMAKQDGFGIPGKLTVKVSLDAWHWETVYETNDLPAPKLGEPVRISIPPRPAKQVWIIGEMFGSYVQGPFNEFWGRCWAVSEIQALKNSSTSSSFVNHALLRHGFNSGPSHNMSVRPGYYVYRTLCTVFNDAEPDAGFEVELAGEGFKDITDFSPDRKVGLAGELVREIIDVWKFRNKKGERLVAQCLVNRIWVVLDLESMRPRGARYEATVRIRWIWPNALSTRSIF